MSTATEQDQAKLAARRVLDHIAEQRFTGLLRVRSREASGEFWFLTGILESAQFGVSTGEEAIERLLRATEVVFEAELRLPHLTGGFKKRMPSVGSFAEARPVVLMRYCETYALTCLLVLKGKDRTVRVAYRLGELLSADAGGDGNEALPALLESEEGAYEFVLPALELPVGVNPIAVAAAKPSLAERIDRSLAEQGAADPKGGQPEAETPRPADASAEVKRKADQAAAAEAKRQADEAAAKRQADEAEAKRNAAQAAAEARRKADQAAATEARRKADQAAATEARRKADQAAAVEAKRKADQAAAAEAKRKADQAAAAEAKRKADEAAAETRRKADQAAAAEAKRKADEAAAEAKRKANQAAAAEAKRKADEAAAAEAQRQAEAAAAEAKRQAEEAAAADAKRTADEFAAAEAAKRGADQAAAGTKRGTKAADLEQSASSSEKELPARVATQGRERKKAPSKAAPSEAAGESAEAAAIVSRKRGFPWLWVTLLLIVGGVVYFALQQPGLR